MSKAARLAIIPAAVVIASWLQPGPAFAEDTREAAVRTTVERDFILGQMRLFLGSIQTILTAAAEGDMKTVAAEAAARGRKGTPASAIPATMKAKESPAWTAMMGSARGGFDAIADAASMPRTTPQDITQRMGETMRTCVACHQSYRLVAE